MNKPIVWMIDENRHQLDIYRPKMERILGSEVEVREIIPPLPNKEDYLQLLTNPDTGCIFIDHKLTDTGEVDYNGIELAQYLRMVDTKVPIFILTNWSDNVSEFSGGEWSVEEIIDKNDERLKPENQAIFAARLLRRMQGYHDILLGREKRFRELLRKSLAGKLTETEIAEMEDLQDARTVPVVAGEITILQRLQQVLNEHQSLMEQLDHLSNRNEMEADNS